MTWNPSNGFWSENNLEQFSGSVTSYMTVTGGYMQVVPNLTRTNSFIASWVDYTGWPFKNTLASRSVVTGDFNLSSGAVFAGEDNNQSGYAQSIDYGRAWKVKSNVLATGSSGYSGEGYVYFGLESGSPNTDFYSYITGGGDTFTLEFDVASYTNVNSSSISGFTSGSTNTLSSRSGVFNHGVYIDNGTYWDYFEISPKGIQSVNHPELALPIDFSGPKRIRIGIDNQDIYLLSENGYSVQGLSKLDNTTEAVANTAKVVFGAPPISGQDFDLYTLNCDYVAGETDWSNIKLVTGQLLLNLPTGSRQSYTTITQTGYTSSFDPQITLQGFAFAEIAFNSSQSGTTTVTPQYSGDSSWIDGTPLTLSGSSPNTISLSDIPVYTTPRTSYGSDLISNPIRFKVEMTSNGVSPPPAIGNIKVFSNHTSSLLELTPSWKPANIPTKINIGITSEESKPEVEKWTTFLYLASSTTGEISGNFATDIASSLSISGEGQIVPVGRFGTAYQNTTFPTTTAQTGSSAELYYGRLPTRNCYPNIFFDLPFTNLSTGAVYTEGQIASLAQVPILNTGQYFTRYEAVQVSRLERQARTNQLASYYNLVSPQQDYAQKVTVEVNSQTSDGQAGIEFIIPSGIVTDRVQLLADVKIDSGTGIYVSATGDTDTVYHFIERSTSNYITVSYEANPSYSGEIAFQLLVPSGSTLTEDISFTVDNVQCKPITNSYIYSSGVPTYLHQSGSVNEATPLLSQEEPFKACTVAYGDFYIEALPRSGQAVLFERLRVSDQEGFTVKVDPQGTLTATYDLYAKAHVSGYTSSVFLDEESIGQFTITGAGQVPVGRWVNIGFIHQQQVSDKLGMADSEFNFYPYNFAMSNRSILTIDGSPVASKDNMTEWQRWDSALNDPAPYVTYIADGTGILTAASGLRCKTNGIYISNPISCNAEVELSIRGAQNTGPYFVPDVFFKPNTVNNNVLVNPFATANALGDDLNIGSIYNFYTPGLTNWDHGAYGNHLLFYGNVSIFDTGNPYNIGGYTRLSTGYALAPYCSAFDRLFNYTGHLGLGSASALATTNNGGTLEVSAWIKPYSTGEVFSMVEDVNNPTSGYFNIYLDSNYNLVSQRVLSDSTVSWSFTGFQAESGEWTWFRSVNLMDNFTGIGSTGAYFTTFFPASGNPTGSSAYTGENFGFQYYGRSGTSTESAFYFGRTADIGICDAVVNPYNPSFAPLNTYNGVPFATGNKGGRYNTILENSSPLTQTGIFSSFTGAVINLPATSSASIRNIWVGTNNLYDSNPRFSIGLPVFDDEPFQEAQGYYIKYNMSGLYKDLGRTDSPIVVGNQVPRSNINLSFLSNNTYNYQSALSTLDLSSYTRSNLAIYNLGRYTTSSNTSYTSSSTGSFESINEEYFTGNIDVTYSGSVFTKDIEVSTIGISDPNLDRPAPAFYYYQIGGTNWDVIAEGANPHITGLSTSTTGSSVDTYLSNKEAILSSISIKDTNGKDIDYLEYPYDIVFSNVSYRDYTTAIRSGQSIQVDSIGTLDTTGTLPTEAFSVTLLLNQKVYANDTSVWVYYKGYNSNLGITEQRREIINAAKIFTELGNSDALIGNYSLNMNADSYQEYDLTLHNIDGDYSGYY